METYMAAINEDLGLAFRYEGGAYIDVYRFEDASNPFPLDGAFNAIHVWNHATGTATGANRLEAFEQTVTEWVADYMKSDYV